MKIAICDDEPVFVDKLKKMVNTYFDDKNIPHSIDTYLNGISLFTNCLKNVDYDLILLDIEMPSIHGTDVVVKLKEQHKNIPTIFISSKIDYGDVAVELRVYRYIYKINIEHKLQEALDSLLHQLINNSTEVDAKDDGENIKIKISNILYLQSCDKTINCYLDNGKIVNIKKSLKDIENDIAFVRFIRIHKSILVNFDRSYYDNKKITLDNNMTLDISRNRKRHVADRYMKLMYT